MPTAKTKKAPAKTPAPPKKVRYVGGRPAGARPIAQRRQVTPGQAARGAAALPGKGVGAAQAVTDRGERAGRYTAKHMLTAELIVGVIIVAIRAVADYEPQADGTLKGKIGHPKGQYGPLPILAGLIVTFFLLSFLASSGGLKGKLAVIAGGIIDLGLLMNSSAEFVKVSDTFGTFGKAKVPPGSWQTSGTAAGEPISGTLSAGSGGGAGPNLNPKGSGKGSSVPPPGSIPVPKGGCPSGYLEESDQKTGAKWCAPTNG